LVVGGGNTGAGLSSAGQVRTPAPTRAVVNIGVISDTHGVLRPAALAALLGSDYIIHAGDIGDPTILEKLAEIAPLTAIRGNVDREVWARKISSTDLLEVGSVSIYVLHNLNELDLKPEASGFDVVVYGHSHVPKQETKNGVLYFNPGSAGPRRFRLPVTIGKLTVRAGKISGEILEILPGVE
jgi:putative phosphoesterase